jgi:hypothetical protein
MPFWAHWLRHTPTKNFADLMDEVEHYMGIHHLEDAALSVFAYSQWSKSSLYVFMALDSSNTMMRGLSTILPRRLTVPFAAILPIDHIHTIAPGSLYKVVAEEMLLSFPLAYCLVPLPDCLQSTRLSALRRFSAEYAGRG